MKNLLSYPLKISNSDQTKNNNFNINTLLEQYQDLINICHLRKGDKKKNYHSQAYC